MCDSKHTCANIFFSFLLALIVCMAIPFIFIPQVNGQTSSPMIVTWRELFILQNSPHQTILQVGLNVIVENIVQLGRLVSDFLPMYQTMYLFFLNSITSTDNVHFIIHRVPKEKILRQFWRNWREPRDFRRIQ